MQSIKDKVDEFFAIPSNWKKLEQPEYFFNGDDNGMAPEDWEPAKLRILMLCLIDGNVKATSSTFNAIYTTIDTAFGKDVFIDQAFLPVENDRKVLTENGLPWIIGNVSHRHPKEYDCIFLSCSISTEALKIPNVWRNIDIPLSTEQRQKDPDCPLILFGGSGSIVSQYITGPISDNPEDGQSLIDVANYGAFEQAGEKYLIPTLIKTLDKSNKLATLEALQEFDYYYVPSFYETVIEEGKSFKIKEFKKLNPKAKDKIKFNRPYDIDDYSFYKKMLYRNGRNSNAADIVTSLGCSGNNSCTFCAEGNLMGPLRERPVDKIKEDMRECKKYFAPNSAGLFSFNLNYLANLTEDVALLGSEFSEINLMTMRMDEISENSIFLDLMKRYKQTSITVALEGIGDRIRNHIYNKNLSKEQVQKCLRAIFKARFTKLKLYHIYSGYETKEDFEDYISELKEMLRIREEEGANTMIQCSFTKLVVYNECPLRYMPRIAAQQNWHNEKGMKYLFDRAREEGILPPKEVDDEESLEEQDGTTFGPQQTYPIRFRMSGNNYSTAFEQICADCHKPFTKVLVKATENDNFFFADKSDQHMRDVIDETAKSFGLDIEEIFRARDLDEVLPTDLIGFATDKRIEDFREKTKKQDFYDRYCLKSHANLDPKCANCGYCPPDRIKDIVKRELHDVDLRIDDVTNAPIQFWRIKYKTGPDMECANSGYITHFITAMLNRNSEEVCDAFYRVNRSNLSSIETDDQKSFSFGTYFYDLALKRPVSQKTMNDLIPVINEQMKGIKVVSISLSDKEASLTPKDYNLWYIETDKYSYAQLKDKFSNFDGKFKVVQDSMGMGLGMYKWGQTESQLAVESICATQVKDKLVMTIILPATVSPISVMMSIFKLGYHRAIQAHTAVCIDTLKDMQGILTSLSSGKAIDTKLYPKLVLKSLLK